MFRTTITTDNNVILEVQRAGKSKRSKGEELTSFVLDTMMIPYVEEFEVEANGRYLRYDFYCEDLKLAIEFNGLHHEKWVSFFQPTYEDFLAQQENDESKRIYSKDNGISLLEIPYSEINNIRQIIERFIGELI